MFRDVSCEVQEVVEGDVSDDVMVDGEGGDLCAEVEAGENACGDGEDGEDGPGWVRALLLVRVHRAHAAFSM